MNGDDNVGGKFHLGADESVAFGVHQRKAEHPEENRARHEVNEILHQNIGCVFRNSDLFRLSNIF